MHFGGAPAVGDSASHQCLWPHPASSSSSVLGAPPSAPRLLGTCLSDFEGTGGAQDAASTFDRSCPPGLPLPPPKLGKDVSGRTSVLSWVEGGSAPSPAHQSCSEGPGSLRIPWLFCRGGSWLYWQDFGVQGRPPSMEE